MDQWIDGSMDRCSCALTHTHRYPKEFRKISDFLQNRTPRECVAFYYDTKFQIPYKLLLEEQHGRRRETRDSWVIANKTLDLILSRPSPHSTITLPEGFGLLEPGDASSSDDEEEDEDEDDEDDEDDEEEEDDEGDGEDEDDGAEDEDDNRKKNKARAGGAGGGGGRGDGATAEDGATQRDFSEPPSAANVQDESYNSMGLLYARHRNLAGVRRRPRLISRRRHRRQQKAARRRAERLARGDALSSSEDEEQQQRRQQHHPKHHWLQPPPSALSPTTRRRPPPGTGRTTCPEASCSRT